LFIQKYIQSTTVHNRMCTFGHLQEPRGLVRGVLVLQKGGVFDEAGLLWGAPGATPRAYGQAAGQEPEGDGRQQSEHPCYDVAQPPGTHPAGVGRPDGDGFCTGGTRIGSALIRINPLLFCPNGLCGNLAIMKLVLLAS